MRTFSKIALVFLLLTGLNSKAEVPEIASLGLGANFIGGSGAFCLNGGLAFAPTVYDNLFFGGDLTFDFFSSPMIEILPTVWYRFPTPRRTNIHPILGFQLGTAISFSGSVALEVGMRLGLEWVVKRTWGLKLEVQGGALSSSFFFKPLVNIVYYL